MPTKRSFRPLPVSETWLLKVYSSEVVKISQRGKKNDSLRRSDELSAPLALRHGYKWPHRHRMGAQALRLFQNAAFSYPPSMEFIAYT